MQKYKKYKNQNKQIFILFYTRGNKGWTKFVHCAIGKAEMASLKAIKFCSDLNMYTFETNNCYFCRK